MGHVQDNAAESVRRVLDRLPMKFAYDYGPTPVQTSSGEDHVDRDKREATVDFTGTSKAARETISTRPSRWRAPLCSTPSA
jgi:5-oxoprolinase (ATP-hydrolysing)